ncbi:hypothetical protein H6G89_27760 [Oscillatoria sp. FACHB-1407]|uniref:hypothetical protein n=1 Tax=Oscillatoria sp. FACHB-1407 TaxID=2692847 RepID=UPI001683FE40|nr:hypothetical protein [Oscillatoria sp. FACHB-1407]MBD2464803.1 hypothetical protein [Oscillatoria sp. FACHB-1407]
MKCDTSSNACVVSSRGCDQAIAISVKGSRGVAVAPLNSVLTLATTALTLVLAIALLHPVLDLLLCT